jgi:hypothetical protein
VPAAASRMKDTTRWVSGKTTRVPWCLAVPESAVRIWAASLRVVSVPPGPMARMAKLEGWLRRGQDSSGRPMRLESQAAGVQVEDAADRLAEERGV